MGQGWLGEWLAPAAEESPCVEDRDGLIDGVLGEEFLYRVDSGLWGGVRLPGPEWTRDFDAVGGPTGKSDVRRDVLVALEEGDVGDEKELCGNLVFDALKFGVD